MQGDTHGSADARQHDEASGTPAVLCVIGTRPEAIKMAPVIRALEQRPQELRPIVCVTEQHRELLDPMLDFFGIRPAVRLGVMREGQSPTEVAARILDRLPQVLRAVRPAALLVQGDTTTTFAAALSAFYAHVPVGHIEAGLRTYDRQEPFPEEMNRQLTTGLAAWHFAPTEWAKGNLVREGVSQDRIFVTGNPVIDALRWTARRLGSRNGTGLPAIPADRRILLVTAHRRENIGARLVELCHALRDITTRRTDVEVLYPVHPNPDVRRIVQHVLGGTERVHLVPPLDYLDLVGLLRRCHLVLTDSGGLQEEAPSFGKPVLILRETTERPEGIRAGTARLVGTRRTRIIAEVERLLCDPVSYRRMARAHNPFGDGRAGQRIAAHVAERLAQLRLTEGASAIAEPASSQAALALRAATIHQAAGRKARRD